MKTTEPAPGLGAVVAGYRLEELVGTGGMGTVYRAVHERLGREAAVKILRRELSSAEYRERFEREARIAAKLDHPNVLPLLDYGEHEGLLYLVMPFVRGHDLRTLLSRVQALDPRQTVAILRQVAAGLDAAHAVGLVHRDVKPANVLVAAAGPRQEAGTTYVTDFGVAKDLSAEGKLTSPGAFVGSRHYASPEQIDAKPIDGRADQYALGCVAYECLTGRPPYDRDSDSGVMFAHLLEAPPSARAVLANLPEAVDDVLAKAMAKSPEDRYPSCAAIVEALGDALGRPVSQAAASSPPVGGGPRGMDETGLQLGGAAPGVPRRGETELLTDVRKRAAAAAATPPTPPVPSAAAASPRAGAREEPAEPEVPPADDMPTEPSSRRASSRLAAPRAAVAGAVVVAVVGLALLISGALSGGAEQAQPPPPPAGPRLGDDRLALQGRQEFEIAAKSLLGNDRGANLRIVGVAGSAALHGKVTLDKAGSKLTYVADPGYEGTARFSYTARDGNGRLGVATVTLHLKTFTRAEQQLLAFVPAGVVSSCVAQAIPPANAVAAVRCRSNLGPLTFLRYPSAKAASAAFGRSFRAPEGDCAGGPATGTWHWPRSSSDAGRFGCKQARKRASFGWTLDSARYVGEIKAAQDVGMKQLNRWFFETVRLKR